MRRAHYNFKACHKLRGNELRYVKVFIERKWKLQELKVIKKEFHSNRDDDQSDIFNLSLFFFRFVKMEGRISSSGIRNN